MPKPQYEVTIMLEGEAGTNPDLLKAAMLNLFRHAMRLPPDRRFDWRAAAIDVQAYTF